MEQCHAMTKAGKRCKRRVATGTLCAQHGGTKSKTAIPKVAKAAKKTKPVKEYDYEIASNFEMDEDPDAIVGTFYIRIKNKKAMYMIEPIRNVALVNYVRNGLPVPAEVLIKNLPKEISDAMYDDDLNMPKGELITDAKQAKVVLDYYTEGL